MDIGKDQSDISRLLQIVDPYNNEQITFSQCVTLFSSVKNYIKNKRNKLLGNNFKRKHNFFCTTKN